MKSKNKLPKPKYAPKFLVSYRTSEDYGGVVFSREKEAHEFMVSKFDEIKEKNMKLFVAIDLFKVHYTFQEGIEG